MKHIMYSIWYIYVCLRTNADMKWNAKYKYVDVQLSKPHKHTEIIKIKERMFHTCRGENIPRTLMKIHTLMYVCGHE